MFGARQVYTNTYWVRFIYLVTHYMMYETSIECTHMGIFNVINYNFQCLPRTTALLFSRIPILFFYSRRASIRVTQIHGTSKWQCNSRVGFVVLLAEIKFFWLPCPLFFCYAFLWETRIHFQGFFSHLLENILSSIYPIFVYFKFREKIGQTWEQFIIFHPNKYSFLVISIGCGSRKKFVYRTFKPILCDSLLFFMFMKYH